LMPQSSCFNTFQNKQQTNMASIYKL